MEKTWQRRGSLAAVCILAVFSVAIAVWRNAQPVPAAQSLPPLQAELSEPTATESFEAPFRFGIWQGRVAVFEGTGSQPVTVLETTVESLPERDQILLAEGIAVVSKEELASLMEDYGS